MIFDIQMQAGRAPATLERILQAARVRGFELQGLDVRPTVDGRHYRVRLTVESELPPVRLIRQLEKQVGISELTALLEAGREAPVSAAASS